MPAGLRPLSPALLKLCLLQAPCHLPRPTPPRGLLTPPAHPVVPRAHQPLPSIHGKKEKKETPRRLLRAAGSGYGRWATFPLAPLDGAMDQRGQEEGAEPCSCPEVPWDLGAGPPFALIRLGHLTDSLARPGQTLVVEGGPALPLTSPRPGTTCCGGAPPPSLRLVVAPALVPRSP